MTTYAIHLADLIGWTEHMPLMCLLSGVLDNEPFNLAASKFASVGLRFDCDEERAKAICETIRLKIKPADLRMYRSKTGTGTWKAI